MTLATSFFSTIELTATQPSDSSGVMVGALLPGVILVAVDSMSFGMLYWLRTNFCAVITPLILEVIMSASLWLEVFLG